MSDWSSDVCLPILCDPQPTAGLWVAQHSLVQFLHTPDLAGVAVVVAQRTARHATLVKVILDARQTRHCVVADTRRHLAAIGHFHQMPEQAETGNVGDRKSKRLNSSH